MNLGTSATHEQPPTAAPSLSPHTPATVHDEGETQWWFDARKMSDLALIATVQVSSCTHVVVEIGEQGWGRGTKQEVVWLRHEDDIVDLLDGAWAITDSEAVYQACQRAGITCGMHITVKDLNAEFGYCVEVCERGDAFIVIDIEHATYIPYELLLAKVEGKGTHVLRSVPISGLVGTIRVVDQSLNAFSTMERGIGVLLRSDSTQTIQNLTHRLSTRQRGRMQLLPAEVVDVQHTGLGHRVCIDATSMMTAEEGMIVGSTGWGGLFVCSETHHLPHMNLREFRVNAGSVHSYVWGPADTALYLSEMRAGAEVLCVDLQGNVRVVTVGRAKIERRPLIRIRCRVPMESVPETVAASVEASLASARQVTPSGEVAVASSGDDGVYVTSFLQNDWHVRLMGADGKVRHSAMVAVGDQLLAHVETPGRHTGLRITEHIIER